MFCFQCLFRNKLGTPFLLYCCLSCLSALSSEEGRFFFCFYLPIASTGSRTKAQLPNVSLLGRHYVGICLWQKSHTSPPLSIKREGPTQLSTSVDSYLLSDLPAIFLHKMGNLFITPTLSMSALSMTSMSHMRQTVQNPENTPRRSQAQLRPHVPLPIRFPPAMGGYDSTARCLE